MIIVERPFLTAKSGSEWIGIAIAKKDMLELKTRINSFT